jgi:hypothetical protein
MREKFMGSEQASSSINLKGGVGLKMQSSAKDGGEYKPLGN